MISQILPTVHNFQNLAGSTFGNLRVISFIKIDGKNRWRCRCQCGSESLVSATNLKTGHVTSCGCRKGLRRHGHAGTPEYCTYQSAKKRCTNPNDPSYHNYGGRGIEFKFKTFSEFFEAIGPRPSSNHSLDRKDNDGHYELDNVQWTTKLEQSLNRRTNRHLSIGDETLTVSQWAERAGTRRNTIHCRLNSGRMCNYCAVYLPAGGQCKHL